MVIELDAMEVAKAKGGSEYTTPIGSLVSGYLSLTPLAQATPIKNDTTYDILVNCLIM